MGKHDPLWIIVLADDGRKQESFEGAEDIIVEADESASETELAATLARAARIAPKQRTVVSLSRAAQRTLAGRLSSYPAENVIVQPYHRGTAAGVLLPFFHVFRRDPMAKVLLLPTSLFVEDDALFTKGLLDAAAATPDRDNRAVLLGMTPQGDEDGSTWILPSEKGVASTFEVVAFSDDPPPEMRAHLIERGALIDSGVIAANTSALLRLYDHALPGLLRSFLVNLRGQSLWSKELLTKLYRFIPKKDFARDLLLPSAEICRVLPVPPCGWVDLNKSRRKPSQTGAGGERCSAEGTDYLKSSGSRSGSTRVGSSLPG